MRNANQKNLIVCGLTAVFFLTLSACGLGPEEPTDTLNASLTVTCNADSTVKVQSEDFLVSAEQACTVDAPVSFSDLKVGPNVVTVTPSDPTMYEEVQKTEVLDTGDNGTLDMVMPLVSSGGTTTVIEDLQDFIIPLGTCLTDTDSGLVNKKTTDLITATTDFIADPSTLADLNGKKGDVEGKISTCSDLLSNLIGAIARASDDNADLTEANTKVGEAETALVNAGNAVTAAEDAIRAWEHAQQQQAIDVIVNQPPTGAIECTGLTEGSNGPTDGILIEVIADGGSLVDSCTTDASGSCTFADVPVGFVEVRFSKAGFVTRSQSVQVEDGSLDQLSVILPLVENPVPTDTLCQRDDIVVLGPTSLSGAFRLADSSGECNVVVPDAEITLSVQSGTSVSVTGLVLAPVGSGNTVISYLWHQNDGNSANDQSLVFTAVAP